MAGTVVFDLDGTLADTSADLIAAANACLTARGLTRLLHPVDDALVAFAGGRAMLREGYARAGSDWIMPPDSEAEDYPRLLDHYGANIAVHTRLYPGAIEALDRLAADGHRLAICTNKPEGLARTLVAELGIADRFAALIGADTLPVRKPDPAPMFFACERLGIAASQCLYVGDHVRDIEAGRNAGMRTAVAGWGYLNDDEDPALWGADLHFDTVQALHHWLRYELS